MFVGYQNNVARYIKNTREELESIPHVSFDKIEEVEFAESFNGVIYTSEEEFNQAKSNDVRAVRNSYLEEYVDPKQLVMVWDGLSEEDKQMYADYRTYLLDYTKSENWWLSYPMTLEEWKHPLKPVVEEPIEEPIEDSNNEVVELYSMEI
jgi:hypothetical protein